jgi:ferric-dicitrate binding protein FerR (iron transport regulator)
LHVDMLRSEALFDVRLIANRTVRVTVQEGRVQLTTTGSGARISLQANQQTTVDYTPTVATLRTRKVSPDSIQRQLSWRRGVLDFDCVKLADAIDEINRYNLLQMQIVGPVAGDDRISGAGFSPTDPTLFAKTAVAVIPNMTWTVIHHFWPASAFTTSPELASRFGGLRRGPALHAT